MSYNENQKTTLKHLVALATRTKSAIEAAIEALPTEMFLDQAKTAFIPEFTFSAETYPGATNPNLDGQPVLVLAVKGVNNKTKTETTTYSFLDVATLLNTYSVKAGDSAKVLNINGYEIEFKVSADTNNSIEVLNDGIAVKISNTQNNALTKDANGLFVDITGKTDKVSNATAGNVAGLDANGNLTDTGVIAANIITTADIATDAEVTEALNGVFGNN